MQCKTGSRPQTGAGKPDRDMALHAITMKRLLHANQIARTRPDPSGPLDWYDEMGTLTHAGDVVLGQRGGKYADRVPVRVLRPGRESTPPLFTTRTTRRAMPGRLTEEQMYVTTRRMCDKLTEQQLRALFAQHGCVSVCQSVTRADTVLAPGFKTVEFDQACRQVARLAAEQMAQLCAEFGFKRAAGYGIGGKGCVVQNAANCATNQKADLGSTVQTLVSSAGSTQSLQSTRPFYGWNPITKQSLLMSGFKTKSHRATTSSLHETPQDLMQKTGTTSAATQPLSARADTHRSMVRWSNIELAPDVKLPPTPCHATGGGKHILNNLYIEDPTASSNQWRGMFRNGNLTFDNQTSPWKNTARGKK